MKNGLPEGWTIVPLSEIAEINPRHPKGLNDSMPVAFVPMTVISESKPEFQFLEERPLGKVRKGFTHFAEGDVLFAKITPCMENGKGAVAVSLRNGLGCGTTELHVLRPLERLDPYFLYRFLAQSSIRRMAKEKFTGTAGQARVPTSFIEQLEIPLPPLPEQRRIVAKLKKLLAKVDVCQRQLAKIPALLRRFRQSVLAAACSGRLTVDWRKERRESVAITEIQDTAYEAPSNWKSGMLGELAKFIDYRGRTPKKVSGGTPLITAKNIRQGYIAREPREFIREEDYNSWMTRGIPRLGDVLITTEAPLGYVAAVDIAEKFALAQRVICLQFHDPCNQAFALVCMMSPAFQEMLTGQSTGTTVSGIKASRLKQMRLLLPPLAEQQEIVRRVEALFTLADQIEARCARAKAHADNLTQSILAKAFRGELVKQDSSNKLASVLLEKGYRN